MGEVWLVEHRMMRGRFAMKLSFGAEGSRERRCLETEARQMQRFKDPRIPYLADYREEYGVSALVMEYVEGASLQDYLLENAPLKEEEALGLMEQVADIIGCLHKASPPVVYRDIKAANFIRSSKGELHLLDFGAVVSGYDKSKGAGAYTRGYCAPEQEQGQETGREADVYAMGALFSFMVTGVDPAAPPYIAVCGRRITNKEMRSLIRDSLEKEAYKRPADAGVFGERLKKIRPRLKNAVCLIFEFLYRVFMILSIFLWMCLIYGLSKGYRDVKMERSALAVFLLLMLWGLFRSVVKERGRIRTETVWDIFYTERSVLPGGEVSERYKV